MDPECTPNGQNRLLVEGGVGGAQGKLSIAIARPFVSGANMCDIAWMFPFLFQTDRVPLFLETFFTGRVQNL